MAKAEKDAADATEIEASNKITKMEFSNKWANNVDYRAPKDKKMKDMKMDTSTSGRNGDWDCQRCMNHNFAFRE